MAGGINIDLQANEAVRAAGDDIYAVEDYSAKHNIPVKVIWMVIRRANRTIMEEVGFLEKKEDDNE